MKIALYAGTIEYTDNFCVEGQDPPTNQCHGYDTKQSDGGVPVMLELWGMQSIRSLPLLPGPLWPRIVVPDRVLSMDQIELNCVLILNWTDWNKTVLKIKLRTYAKLMCLIYNSFWHRNCISA